MNLLKKTIFSVFLVALLVFVSGCIKKPVEPNKDIVTVNQNAEEQGSENSQKQAGIQNETEDQKDYEITQNENGWQTFRSYKCGFEISFPNDFNLFSHCEDKDTLLIIDKIKDNTVYLSSGDITYELKKIKVDNNDLDKWVKQTFKLGYSKNDKLGDVNTVKKNIEIYNTNGYLIDLEYDNPMEGPSGIIKHIFFKYKGEIYGITSYVPLKNKDMIESFNKISDSLIIL